MLYLGTAGVGRITIVDHDAVDLTNLQRQIAHNLQRMRVQGLREAIAAINPDVLVQPLVLRADAQVLDELVPQADVVVDCCDNFATRTRSTAPASRTASRWCPARRSASIDAGERVRPRRADCPCYACVFPPDQSFEETLRHHGRVRALVGIIGAMQASEALRLLAGGTSLAGRLQMLDGAQHGMERDARAATRPAPCGARSG